MMGSFRRTRLTLAVGLWSLVVNQVQGTAWGRQAQDSRPAQADKARGVAPAAKKPGADRPAHEGLPALPGQDAVSQFVPLRPATVEDRQQTEVARLYSAARGLEDQHDWADAAALFKEALKLDSGSVAIARRLCRIYIGPLGRPDLALEFGRKALAGDPNDTNTLTRLFEFYDRTNPAMAESLCREVVANPKLDEHSASRLLASYELGKLYSGKLRQVSKAADAFAVVMKGLDDRAANRLPPAVQQMILGRQPELAYLNFGFVFLAADRLELAAQAFEHGLVYDEDNPQISLLLADTLLRLKRGDQALVHVERSIRRQPQGADAYELLAKILTALHREAEIMPRLEDAARRDSKNVPLQYYLADRYREIGQTEKADALYKELLRSQPTPQTYRALATSLLKRKRATELLKLFCEALKRPGSPDAEAVSTQLQAAALDDSLALGMLDAGLELLSQNPPGLSPSSVRVLTFIANAGGQSGGRDQRIERLIKIQRLLLEREPSPLLYSEIADAERRLGRYAAAARELEKLLTRYPNERNARTVSFLAEFHQQAGHNEAFRLTLDQALKLDPSDGDAQVRIARLLSNTGRVDEAVRVLRAAARREPNNALYDIILGGVLIRFNRNDEAIKLFEGLLKRFGENEEVVSLAHSSLSLVYVNLGNYARGEAELETILKMNPEDAGSNNDLGYLYAEQGKKLEQAESMIRKALKKDPENRSYLDSLGWVLFKRGRARDALEPMKKAAERMQAAIDQEGQAPDATIFEHLGDIYFQLEDIEKAADAWRQALKAAGRAVPPDKRLVEIRRKLDSLDKLDAAAKPSTRQTP